jgi:prepilin-type processing-associated H-X9-DG protein
MPGALQSSGLTAPLWFCPVRPTEFDTANKWSTLNLGHAINTIPDLTAYLTSAFGSFCLINHDWWVPRQNGGTLLPTTTSGTARLPDGWPSKSTDKNAAVNPIISDLTGHVGISTTASSILPTEGAHFFNGTLSSINTCYADGHVVTIPKSQIQWEYYDSDWTMFY